MIILRFQKGIFSDLLLIFTIKSFMYGYFGALN